MPSSKDPGGLLRHQPEAMQLPNTNNSQDLQPHCLNAWQHSFASGKPLQDNSFPEERHTCVQNAKPPQVRLHWFEEVVTYSVPTSPASKPKVEPIVSKEVAGIGEVQNVWYHIENQVQPLQACFQHNESHISLLSVFPADDNQPIWNCRIRLVNIGMQCWSFVHSASQSSLVSCRNINTHAVMMMMLRHGPRQFVWANLSTCVDS